MAYRPGNNGNLSDYDEKSQKSLVKIDCFLNALKVKIVIPVYYTGA